MLNELKMKEEEEKLFYEKQYNNTQEELREKDALIKELRDRYKAALQEIKDLEEEHENEHSDLLNTVRDQESEIKLLNGMLSILLTSNEILSIRRKSDYNEDNKEWVIPYFFLKGKQVQFPTLSRNKARDLVESEKQNRDVVFQENINIENDLQPRNNKQMLNSSSHPSLLGNAANEDVQLGQDASTNFLQRVQNMNTK